MEKNDNSKKFRKWHYKIKFEIPNIYNECLRQNNYLAACLIACNLVEFHSMQYLLEFSQVRQKEIINQLAKNLRLLPNLLISFYIKIRLKFLRRARVPSYYIEQEFTLGRLIKEAEQTGVKNANKRLIKSLKKFNERRKMIVHKLLYLENIDKDIKQECQKTCDLANEIWDQFKLSKKL